MQKQTASMANNLLAFFFCAAAVALDQFTKWLAAGSLKGNDGVDLIPGVFKLYYLENRGAAFGLFQERQFFFLVSGLAVLFAVGFVYGKIPCSSRFFWLRFCAVLVCAGAAGNMIDRVRLHYVVDFLYFCLIDFPVFNLADCYVVVSCAVFAFCTLFYYKEEDFYWLRRDRDGG